MLASLSFVPLSFVLALASTCDAGRSRLTSTSTLITHVTVTGSRAAISASATPKNWYKPTQGTSFLVSYSKAIPANPKSDSGINLNQAVYDVDLFDTSAAQIQKYKDQGKKVMCYFSAGSIEDWRPDLKNFTSSCYCNFGNSCSMGWPGEWWFDIHSQKCIDNIQAGMRYRLDMAVTKKCDGVEPDNVDSYINKPGWATTIGDQFEYLKFLSEGAHNRSLAIVLKNSVGMIKQRPEVVNMFDAVLIEQCQQYKECAGYKAFVDAKKPAWQIEYADQLSGSLKCAYTGFTGLLYSDTDTVDYLGVTDLCPK